MKRATEFLAAGLAAIAIHMVAIAYALPSWTERTAQAEPQGASVVVPSKTAQNLVAIWKKAPDAQSIVGSLSSPTQQSAAPLAKRTQDKTSLLIPDPIPATSSRDQLPKRPVEAANVTVMALGLAQPSTPDVSMSHAPQARHDAAVKRNSLQLALPALGQYSLPSRDKHTLNRPSVLVLSGTFSSKAPDWIRVRSHTDIAPQASAAPERPSLSARVPLPAP